MIGTLIVLGLLLACIYLGEKLDAANRQIAELRSENNKYRRLDRGNIGPRP